MRFLFLFITLAFSLQCASPVNSGNQEQSATDGDVQGIPIQFERGVLEGYKYGGSCEFREGFCAQVYSPDVVDAATMLVLMVKNGSCRLVRTDEGERHCQDRPRHGRCLLDPVKPGGAPEGTLVQMDIFYSATPGKGEQQNCNTKGTYYPPPM
ncbi:MAG: hypothetical protein CMF59_02560 [Leptospiraceae bacterium]|nr:hypothetical protein [Leptospiraceae bacterium]